MNSFTILPHIDSGILYTAKELYIRPGTVANEYIEGKRKKYFNPFQYLILMVAVSMFLTVKFSLLGPKPDASMLSNAGNDLKFSFYMRDFFYHYFNLVLFLTVPVTAFFSFIFFKRPGYNYSENLIFNSFLAAQRTLTFILLSPLLYFLTQYWYIFIGFYYLFWLVYFTYAYWQFFNEGKLITTVKFVIMYILLFAVVQGAAMAVVNLFYMK